MQHRTLALVSATLGMAAAQAVTSAISPSGTAPAGCAPSLSSNFEITVIEAGSAAAKTKREMRLKERSTCGGEGTLVAALSDGVIKDQEGRTGYIASNYQFQFDGPPQAGAIYTAGFSVCGNESLALGTSEVFYQCKSGDFWNLYDRSWAAQCSPVEILVMPCDTTDSDPPATGDVVGTEVLTTTVVVPLSDGQPQVRTTTVPIPLCQITDGQVQVRTTPCASITTASTISTVAPVSQYSDGQIQVTPVGSTSTTPVTTTVTSPVTTVPSTLVPATVSGTAIIVPSPSSSASVGSVSVSSVSAVSATSALSVTSATVATSATGTTTTPAGTSAPSTNNVGRIGIPAALAAGALVLVW